MSRNIFDNPAIGVHTPLDLRWTHEQLAGIVELLAPLLPPDLRIRRIHATASVARAIVYEQKSTGGGVHFSRRTDFYNKPRRYRCGDPLYTHHFVTTSMKLLEDQGLVDTTPGIWNPSGQGFQSVAWPTDDLLALVGPFVDVAEERGILESFEPLVLRNEAKVDIDYVDDENTDRMRAELTVINHHLSSYEMLRAGERIQIPVGRRVFNVNFERGGRLYLFGESYQMIPSRVRPTLKLVIDGQERPVTEVDYASLHPRMAYREAGVHPPDDDLYRIDGFDRDFVKRGVNVLLNAKTTNKAILALIEELGRDQELRRLSGAASKYRNDCRAVVVPLVEAIENKHAPIKDSFGSNCGAGYQRLDSDMAVEVMLSMIAQTGRCPLPIHDSFLVADLDVDLLKETMIEVARVRDLPVQLKVTPPDHLRQ